MPIKTSRVITLQNKFIEEMEQYREKENLPDYPIQNALTQGIRKAAAMQNKTDFMSLFSGQGIRLSRSKLAKELITDLEKEADKAIESLQFK